MDYYKILGVSKDASSEEIKKAFHRLAHKHHPHKGGDEKKFKQVNEAYQVLSNQDKRAQYDQFGQVFDGQGSGPDVNSWAWGNPGSGQGVEFDLGDMFEDFLGFKGKRSRQRDFRIGKNIKIDIELSLEDVLKDITKNISLYKHIPCSRCEAMGAEPGTKVKECSSCRGTGQVQQIKKTFLGSFTQWGLCPECKGEGQMPENPCNVCKGEGRVKGEKDIKIFIPAGVDSNQVIEIQGQGNAGKKGGPSGDLYVRILIRQHPVFERRGDDLFLAIPIQFSQAALGDEIEVPTLDAKDILLKVPSGIESGKILKISGKGIPRFNSYGRGDIYVQLIVKPPRKLSRRQKELLKELKKEGL